MTITQAGRPTFAAIDAAALRHNFASLRAMVPREVAVLAVVKADGYGHGVRVVARVFETAGAEWFGVATLQEAVELREAGVRKPILLLTGAAGADVPTLREHRLSTAILHRDMARELAAAWGGAAAGSSRLGVHLKIDTGMGRIGVSPGELPALLDELQRTQAFDVEGVFSHFANADRVDQEYSEYQLRLFREALATLAAHGLRPRWIHIANSAATMTRADAHFSMVRPGIMLYGVPPSAELACGGLRPAMRLVSHVVQLKSVPSEFPVSYGQSFVTRRPSLIATVPIGYADGYSRALSNRAAVLVRGRRAPVIGAVCMDLTMIDVTDVAGVQLGDEVVLWGKQGEADISVAEVAAWQGTISYEVLTRLGKRVPRVLQE
jgi:alanine racemase